MARQLSYTTSRIGLYDVFREMAAPGSAAAAPGSAAAAVPLTTKLGCGLSAGAIAATL